MEGANLKIIQPTCKKYPNKSDRNNIPVISEMIRRLDNDEYKFVKTYKMSVLKFQYEA